jgi:hypothetical protein
VELIKKVRLASMKKWKYVFIGHRLQDKENMSITPEGKKW